MWHSTPAGHVGNFLEIGATKLPVVRSGHLAWVDVPGLHVQAARAVGWKPGAGPLQATQAVSTPPLVAAPVVVPDPPSEPPAAAPADLTVLEGNAKSARAAIRSGGHDGTLAALLSSEVANKARSSVVSELQRRLDSLGA